MNPVGVVEESLPAGRKAAEISRFAVGVSVALLAMLLSACAHLQPRPQLPEERAIEPGVGGALDRGTAELEAAHQGQSAFRLVADGTEAFAVRAQSARLATRSLDVQTYIWHPDTTGMFLAYTLLEAADRGVKVRLLLDDMDARAKNSAVAALAAHPNIEVRLFNPFASRSGKLSLIGEGLTDYGRVNRRMHNKTWIADNRIAIAGGRNLGDEYFGASDGVNFVDLDFAMVGPVVRDASASFDKYWNSQAVYPIQVLDPKRVDAAALEKLRAALSEHVREASSGRYATALRGDDAIKRMLAGDWPMEWTQSYTFVSDDPLKVTMTRKEAKRTYVGATLGPMLNASEREATIISPYFVPGKTVTAGFVKAAQTGEQVRILTNSLAANDVASVHGGYSTYRKTLVAGGVQLWELKPLPGVKGRSSLFGSSGASLHTKALAVDSQSLFVGSYNLDPRSTWLNCEQGVIVKDPKLAIQLEGIFATQTDGEKAWRVTLKDNELHWSDGKEDFNSDPKASAWKRFQAWLARVLNLESQL